ncbi:DNA repair protein RecO [Lacrimispora sp. 210928-DFI.3.58]|uniref:DNA repair protein RecO n=1 Tax=Lacrimispora sp. 210928-DFI.3.58 TaxID=2883214 RepID=UPI0015B5E8A4|nr:DNA repair protein RecO [Lacrimispora sp. 210928-DFI.3.58]MCB7318639.1 DNA repair protein RecO [Lacrimispora sp. 210928-DFI.3.58]
MRETVTLTGIVLISAPSGEYDRRLVLLTKERGKVTAFAHGARKPGNPLMAASRTFSFGSFSLYEGRSAYNLQSAQISNYFDELSTDMEAACYGSYFLEAASYYAQENMDETELLKLLYQSLRALTKPALPNRLVRRVFELKAMVIEGEYTEKPPMAVSESCTYAWEYVVYSPSQSLYNFTLKEEVLLEFERAVESSRRRFVRHEFRSLEILEMMAVTFTA